MGNIVKFRTPEMTEDLCLDLRKIVYVFFDDLRKRAKDLLHTGFEKERFITEASSGSFNHEQIVFKIFNRKWPDTKLQSQRVCLIRFYVSPTSFWGHITLSSQKGRISFIGRFYKRVIKDYAKGYRSIDFFFEDILQTLDEQSVGEDLDSAFVEYLHKHADFDPDTFEDSLRSLSETLPKPKAKEINLLDCLKQLKGKAK